MTLTPQPSDTRAIAARVLAHEAGGSADIEELVAATHVVVSRIHDDLVTLVGNQGVYTLLRRAINLARNNFPVLAGVFPQASANVCLDGLGTALSVLEPEAGRAVCEAVLAELFGLLVSILGDDLGLRFVRMTWPAPLMRENG